MNKVMAYIVIFTVVFFLSWCFCKAASKADRMTEEYFKDKEKKHDKDRKN